jgi:hypothetical protein
MCDVPSRGRVCFILEKRRKKKKKGGRGEFMCLCVYVCVCVDVDSAEGWVIVWEGGCTKAQEGRKK